MILMLKCDNSGYGPPKISPHFSRHDENYDEENLDAHLDLGSLLLKVHLCLDLMVCLKIFYNIDLLVPVKKGTKTIHAMVLT